MLQVTRRDALILAGFLVVLVLVCVGVVKRVGAPSSGSEVDLRQPTRPIAGPVKPAGEADRAASTEAAAVEAGGFLETALAPGKVPPKYAAITERKLFEPLIKVKSKPAPPIEVPKVPAVQGKPPAQSAVETVQSQDNEESPTGDESNQTAVAPPKPPLAVTGLLRLGDSFRVVVEQTEFKDSRVLKVGDEAFGYRLVEVSEAEKKAVFVASAAPDNPRLTLKLGENKTVETGSEGAQTDKAKSSTEGEGANQPSTNAAPPASSFGMRRGFDPSQLTPEQRARFEQYRSRRGRGGSGGYSRGDGG